MNKMRVSLTEKHGEIRGTVESSGDDLFVFECLAEIVGQIAKRTGIEPGEIVRDLYSFVNGKVVS